jgi:diacylglycerol kinase family enzyme
VPPPPESAPAPIPAFVNRRAGSAREAITALAADPRFRLHEIGAEHIGASVRAAAADGARRILVCGGDGSITAAAAALGGSAAELAVLPGGTLNHFARDHGIPTEPDAALDLAATGDARPVDAGEMNGRLFLNTSSVGAYVSYVHARERLEPLLGYRLSSLVATLRIYIRLRSFDVLLGAGGAESAHRTPLVFIGVGERQLRVPGFGRRIPGGRRGLHVVVVRGKSRARILALALAAARGFRSVTRTPMLEAFVVDRCHIEMRRPRGNVATDGEIAPATAPLVYRLLRDHVRVVTGPEPAAGTEGADA